MSNVFRREPSGRLRASNLIRTVIGSNSHLIANEFFIGTTPPAPTVTNLNVTCGSQNGGTSVIITGTGFTGATDVKFGTTSGTSLTVNSDTQITVTALAHAAGAVDVTVVGPGGTSATSSVDQFTYGLIAGDNTPGNNDGGVWSLASFVRKVTFSESGALTSVKAYLLDNTYPNHTAVHFRAVVYADNGNTPVGGSLLATGTEVTLADNAAAGWITLPMSAALPVTATSYWVGWVNDCGAAGEINYGCTLLPYTDSSVVDYIGASTYPTAPSPWATSGPSDTGRRIAIYATYTTTAAAGIKVWNGSTWAYKPVKVWNGSAWVVKPVKVWNGSSWITKG